MKIRDIFIGFVSSRRAHLFTLIVLTPIVYLNVWNYDFVFDDYVIIHDNPLVRGTIDLGKIFSSSYWSLLSQYSPALKTSQYYRPLLTIVYALEYRVFGLYPMGYHMVNLLFHIMNTIIVYLVADRLLKNRKYAFIAALLFAFHPEHTESVTWISGLTDVLCLFFLGLTFYIHTWIDEKPYFYKRLGGSLLAGILFFAALLCKEAAIAFPLLIIGYELMIARRTNYPVITLYASFTVLYLVMRLYVLGSLIPITTHPELTTIQIAMNAIILLFAHIQQLLLPVKITPFHLFSPILSLRDYRFVLSLIFLFAIVFIIMGVARKNKGILFVLLWMVLFFLPVLNVRHLGGGEEGWNIFAERFSYIPSLGFVILLPLLWIELSRRFNIESIKVMAIFIITVILSFYSIQTTLANRVWKDNITFLSEGLKRFPMSAAFNNDLGFMYMQKGELKKGEEYLKRALRLNNRYEKSHFNLGLLYTKTRQWEKAIKHFKIANILRPDYIDTYLKLANIYIQTGQIDQSEIILNKVIKLKPDSAPAYLALGILYGMKGRYDNAIQEFKQVIALEPDNASAYYYIGLAFQKKGMIKDAVYYYQKAIEIKPDHVEAERRLHSITRGQPRLGKDAKKKN